MTSQKDQLQTLIAEIDKVLQKASPRLPWVMSGDVEQQRRVLERVRSYLVSLQQKQAIADSRGTPRVRSNLSAYDIQYQPPQSLGPVESSQLPSQQDAAQQIVQAVVQEMDHLRASLTGPLQADLEALRQQREALVQDIRKLEAQRSHYSLAQQQANQQQVISEFLKVLMGRLQESLTQQVSQTLTTAMSQSLLEEGRPTASTALSSNLAGAPLLHPAQRLEELQMLQARSDQLLMTLDSTLSVLFEALQRNVQSYQESLSRGLERMHDLGQQGEVMFTALVSHLAQQLGREASSYLQQSIQTPSLESSTPPGSSIAPNPVVPEVAPEVPPPQAPPVPPLNTVRNLADLDLPYPGTELPSPSPDWNISSQDEPSSLDDLNLEAMNLADLNIDNVETLLEVDLSELEANLEDSDPELGDPRPKSAAPLPGSSALPVQDRTDLATELDFLQQLDEALHEQTEETDAPASSERSNSGLQAPEPAAGDIAQKPPIPDELDEFYTSLFGTDAIASSETLETFDFEEMATTPGSAHPEPLEPSAGELEALTDSAIDAQSDLPAIAEGEATTDDSVAFTNVEELFGDFTGFDSEGDTYHSALEISRPAAESAIASDEDAALQDLETFLFAESTEATLNPEAGDRLDSSADFTADPEVATPSTPEATPEFAIDDLSTAFANDDSQDSIAELANLLGDTPEPEFQASSSIQPPSISQNTERSELELTNDQQFSAAEPTLDDFSPRGLDATNKWVEDSYILAAPEESLLASDDLGDAADVSLWLDDHLVQQLNQDLSTLETADRSFDLDLGLDSLTSEPSDSAESEDLFLSDIQASPAPTPETAKSEENWDDLTLGDFAQAIPETPEPAADITTQPAQAATSTPWDKAELPPTTTPDVTSDDLTLEALDDFFGDIPAAPPEEAMPSPSHPPVAYHPTGVDTQSMTLEDAFGNFSAENPDSSGGSADSSGLSNNPTAARPDEKKKIQ